MKLNLFDRYLRTEYMLTWKSPSPGGHRHKGTAFTCRLFFLWPFTVCSWERLRAGQRKRKSETAFVYETCTNVCGAVLIRRVAPATGKTQSPTWYFFPMKLRLRELWEDNKLCRTLGQENITWKRKESQSFKLREKRETIKGLFQTEAMHDNKEHPLPSPIIELVSSEWRARKWHWGRSRSVERDCFSGRDREVLKRMRSRHEKNRLANHSLPWAQENTRRILISGSTGGDKPQQNGNTIGLCMLKAQQKTYNSFQEKKKKKLFTFVLNAWHMMFAFQPKNNKNAHIHTLKKQKHCQETKQPTEPKPYVTLMLKIAENTGLGKYQ